jgi:hypothetical protein
MSIKVATQVWRGSQHKSGNLLVLLALADHADDQGKAWPKVPSVARKARLSQRHTRRCLNELVASGELTILAQQAPSGGKLYQIQLGQLTPDNLSTGTSPSNQVTTVSSQLDGADHEPGNTYIEEPSTKSSEQSRSQMTVSHIKSQKSPKKHIQRKLNVIELVSAPKNGF